MKKFNYQRNKGTDIIECDNKIIFQGNHDKMWELWQNDNLLKQYGKNFYRYAVIAWKNNKIMEVELHDWLNY